jgi:two-component system CheB/CheR fusion protein
MLDLAHVLARDLDDHIIFWNSGAEAMYGWTAAEALGRLSHELLRTEFPRPLAEVWDEVLEFGVWEGELTHRRKDGSRVVVASHWALDQDEEGRPVRILEVNNDITQLRQAQEALREADRRKDAFLAMLAHELRNPLAPIRNAVHILQVAGASDPATRPARDMIERQVAHMTRLIDDLLEVSRVGQGKVNLRKGPADLLAILRRAVDMTLPQFQARQHRLSVALPEDALPLRADATRLEQVFTNLLTNAAKYTGPGGHVELEAVRRGDEAVVRVKDNGVGIAPELLPHVFEPFVQGQQGPDRQQGGLGIGLTLVRSLVGLHGGSVRASSAGPGLGSEFVVRLPLADTACTPTSAGSARPAGEAPPSRRVLVVDDNVDAAQSLAELLRQGGHDVRVAGRGPDALAVAAEFAPEAVFLDIGLPGMDGYEVARRLRRQEGDRRVLLVAVTGYGTDEDRRRSREAGFDHHLVKPAAPSDVQDLLARLPSSP